MQYNQGMTNPYLQQQQTYYPTQYGAAYQNAVPIGGGEYNGGYNFGYYGYGIVSYDPLEIRRMQEEEQERRNREYTNSINVAKKMLRASNYYFTGDTNDEELDEQFSYDNMQQKYNKYMYDMHLERLSYLNEVQESQREQYYRQLAEYNNANAEPIKHETLIQFLEGTATDRYMEIINNRYISQSRNIGRLYNHDNFAELIHLHNRDNNTNPIFNPMITVDDLEISLPQKLRNDYEERRAQFIKAIVDSNPIRL